MSLNMNGVSNYVPYGVTGSVAATGNQVVVKEHILEHKLTIEETIKEVPMLMQQEWFYDLVEAGILSVKNGELFLYGLNLVSMITLLTTFGTFMILLIKFMNENKDKKVDDDLSICSKCSQECEHGEKE